MAQVITKKTINHFTHPSHPLAELCSETEYFCNSCHILGVGPSYFCRSCNFNLHGYCASCPASLLSAMHPHSLTLDPRNPHHERLCNLCGSHVRGIFYSCKVCDFDLHPICAQLSDVLRHVLDIDHPLRLQQPSPVPLRCAVCGAHCNTSWHYGCRVCGLDIHLDCVLAPCGLPTGQHRSFPPPPQPPTYGDFANYGYGGSHGYTSYNNLSGYHVNYNQPPQPQPQPPPLLPSGGYGYGCGLCGFGYGPHGFADSHQSMYYGNANYYQPQHQPQAQANYYQPQAQEKYYQHQPQLQPQAQGGGATNGGLPGRIFSIVGSLASGVLSNAIFGLITQS